MLDGLAQLTNRQPGLRAAAAITLLAAVVAVGFGAVGLGQLQDFDNDPLNLLYGVASLFALDGGFHNFGQVPFALQVAQILAPLSTLSTGLLVLGALTDSWIRRRRAGRLRRHTVVIGAGHSGGRVLNALAGEPHVVVIDRQPTAEIRERCGRNKWPLFVADGLDSDIGARAAISHAQSVFVCTGSDDRDLLIARTLAGAADHNSETLTKIHVRLDSATTARALLAFDHDMRSGPGHVMEYISHVEFAAMAIQEVTVSQVAVRLSRAVGDQLVDRAVFMENCRHLDALHDIMQRSHRARSHLGLETLAGELLDPGQEPTWDSAAATLVFIGRANRADSLQIALSVAGRAGVVAVVALSDSGVAQAWVNLSDRAPVLFLDPEAILDSPAMMEQGHLELLARLIHADYLSKIVERSELDPTKAAHRPWSELDEEIRASNRDQAQRFLDSLQRLDLRLVPQGEARQVFEFSPDLIESEARVEHELWCQAHKDDGWRFDPTEDRRTKRHPHLVPWRDLTESVRDYDRDAVIRRPALAALLGLEITADLPGSAS